MEAFTLNEIVPIGVYIAKIKLMQERIFTNILKEYGINDFNSPQSRILFTLWTEDNITISQLSKRTALAKTTLTSMLDRLESQGLINRIYSPDDRRSVKITVSDKTRSLEKHYEKARLAMKDINFKGFSPEEIDDLEQKLIRVLNNLHEYSENYIK